MRVVIDNTAMTAVANIQYLQGMYGVTDEVMAQKMGISRPTWANRKNRPQQMTLKELMMAVAFFQKKGMDLNASQLMVPMAPAKVDPLEVSA